MFSPTPHPPAHPPFVNQSDVDECAEEIHSCQTDVEECRNTEGAYECDVKCENGFEYSNSLDTCVGKCSRSSPKVSLARECENRGRSRMPLRLLEGKKCVAKDNLARYSDIFFPFQT